MSILRIVLTLSLLIGNSLALAENAVKGPRHSPARNTILDSYRGALAQAPSNGVEAPEALDVSQLDAQIASLTEERRQIRMGGPIAMTAVGGGAALVGGILAGAAAAACNQADNDPFTECRQDRANALIIGGAVAAGVGVVLVIVGAIRISSRKGERRAIDGQIRELERKKRSVLDGVDYGFDLRGDRQMLTMRLEF